MIPFKRRPEHSPRRVREREEERISMANSARSERRKTTEIVALRLQGSGQKFLLDKPV